MFLKNELNLLLIRTCMIELFFLISLLNEFVYKYSNIQAQRQNFISNDQAMYML